MARRRLNVIATILFAVAAVLLIATGTTVFIGILFGLLAVVSAIQLANERRSQ